MIYKYTIQIITNTQKGGKNEVRAYQSANSGPWYANDNCLLFCLVQRAKKCENIR